MFLVQSESRSLQKATREHAGKSDQLKDQLQGLALQPSGSVEGLDAPLEDIVKDEVGTNTFTFGNPVASCQSLSNRPHA